MHTLTNYQQRGTLVYINPQGERTTVNGWFHVNGKNDTQVVMRKIGGRNQFLKCCIAAVVSFTVNAKAGR